MNKELKSLILKVNKKNTDKLVSLYNDIGNTKIVKVTTGLPSLDYIMGGGNPMGRIVEVYGPESSGKSTICIQMLIQIQKTYPDSFQVYIDIEHGFDGEYAKALGLNLEKIIFSQPSTAEESLDLLTDFAEQEAVSAIVFDSIGQMPTAKEVNGHSGDAEMGMRARLLSACMRKLAPISEKSNTLILLINQVRTNIGQMWGNPEVTPGGAGPKFAASIRLRTSIKKDQKDPNFGITTFKVEKNKVGKPFRKTEIKIVFGKGFEIEDDFITLAITLGVIGQNGPSYYFRDKKVVGKEKLKALFSEDGQFKKDVKEAIERVDETNLAISRANEMGIIEGSKYNGVDYETEQKLFSYIIEDKKQLKQLKEITKNSK